MCKRTELASHRGSGTRWAARRTPPARCLCVWPGTAHTFFIFYRAFAMHAHCVEIAGRAGGQWAQRQS